MARSPRPVRAAARSRTSAVRPVLAVLGGLAFLAWGASLLVRQAARWTGGHPVLAGLAALVAVPVLVVLVRGMPSGRELRREIRAGMAEAEEAVAEDAGTEEAVAQEVLAEEVLAEAGHAVDASALHAMDPDEFEQAVALLCERDGCRDVEVVGGAGDLGADVLALAPDGRRVVVQCKRYAPDHKVGSQDLQRFGGTCYAVHGADVAVLVTTSAFTEPATAYAATVGIRCWDGPLLAAWYEGTGPAPWSGADEDGASAPVLRAEQVVEG